MTINYGKRNPGGLTAANPGDTLYVPFSTFNDSGASIGIGGTLAISDLEIFKNGNATSRATDSGYSLISDTGQYGDFVGLHRFSIQLFNNSEDTGFYDVGSQYHVAVDSITVDGRTVRFFPAVFEIGTPRANIVEIDGDTGFADRLGKLASLLSATGTIQANTIATDAITAAKVAADAIGASELAADAATEIATAVWSTAGRKLAVDTGIAEQVWRSPVATYGDTGTFGEELGGGVNVVKIDGDTGPADNLGTIFTGVTTLSVNVDQVDGDTGAADVLGKFAETKLASDGAIDTGALAGTKAGTIDANVTDVNSVSVGGTGTGGDPWGPT